jgi:hypothetical protein
MAGTLSQRFITEDAATYYIFYYSKLSAEFVNVSKLMSRLEAAIGIEPMNKGFADLCLTTWLRRRRTG